MCTIRGHPTSYEHCVIWAKEYYLEEIKSPHFSYSRGNIGKDGYKTNDEDDILFLKIESMLPLLLERESIIFDKDDDLIMKFIYYVSVLRSRFFSIKEGTYFMAQSIAGNIILAICTTNSIVASLMYLMGEKILNGDKAEKNYYLTRNGRLIIPMATSEPNKWCDTCNIEKYVYEHDGSVTLRDFVNTVLSFLGGELSIFEENLLIYDKYLKSKLDSKLNVNHNSLVLIKNNLNEKMMVYVLKGERVLMGKLRDHEFENVKDA